MSGLTRILPSWIRNYTPANLSDDLVAGIIVTILVIPQSLAYALLAGLPPQAGLYASIFPVLTYALFGSSMTQAVGPVAITAIMTFSVLSPLAEPHSAQYVMLAATLSLFSGLLVLTFGLLHLGFLSQLLSRPVVSGFISGSAILIVISQIKFIAGVQAGGSNSWQVLQSIFLRIEQANPYTLALGCGALLLLLATRNFLASALLKTGLSKKSADLIVRVAPLLIVILATSLVVALDLDVNKGVAVVGTVAEGFAALNLFVPEFQSIKMLLVPAIILAVIGMIQNITMAQALAIKRHERVDANHELVGLGCANIVSAFYGGMPVGGGCLDQLSMSLLAQERPWQA